MRYRKRTNLGLGERNVQQKYGSQLPVEGQPGVCFRDGVDEKGRTDQDRKRPRDCSKAMKAPMTAQYVESAWRVSAEAEWARALYVE